MKRFFSLMAMLLAIEAVNAVNKYDNPDTLYVARDGSAEFRNIADALEVCRAFMTYHKVIFVREGTYKEKLEVPTWLNNIEICGENAEKTIITYDDHANIPANNPLGKIGTFRSWTVKVTGSDITFKNITIENSSGRKGQAVALHIEGDKVKVIGCRLLGNQDTVYTGRGGTRQYFKDCYISGTTDFIFGPGTAWFENCDIISLVNSFVTAASTPQDQKYGYIFNNCRIDCLHGQEGLNSNFGEPIDKVFLGRPWRPYAYTLFMNCEIGGHIVPEGWFNWSNPANEKTARFYEYNNHGAGAKTAGRVSWVHQMTKKEAQKITLQEVFGDTSWL